MIWLYTLRRAGRDSNPRLLPPEGSQEQPGVAENVGFAGVSANDSATATRRNRGGLRSPFDLAAPTGHLKQAHPAPERTLVLDPARRLITALTDRALAGVYARLSILEQDAEHLESRLDDLDANVAEFILGDPAEQETRRAH